MRQMLDLSAEPRAELGKGPTYQGRRKGRIPGIVYGGDSAPKPISIDERTLGRLYGTGGFLQTLVMLDVGGEKTRVIPRAVQLDPVTDRPVHVDFLRLVPGGTVKLDIPVHFKGQENSPGIKRGGVLNVVRHEVALICPVDAIPEYIEGDLDGLDIGDSLHISAFTLPQGVRPAIRERDFTVATIAPPTTFVEEVAPTAAATAAEGAEAVPAEGAAGEAAPGAAAGAAAAPAPEKGKAAEKK